MSICMDFEETIQACRDIEATGYRLSASLLADYLRITPGAAAWRLRQLRNAGLVTSRPPRVRSMPDLSDAHLRERIAKVRAATKAKGRFLIDDELADILDDRT